MSETFFIIMSLCFINMFIVSCYNINHRFSDTGGHVLQKAILNKKLEISYSPSIITPCIPVQAVKELGCIVSKNNNSFEGLFQSICERHQLCYACGFARSITEQQCNKIALVKLYNVCSKNKSLSSTICMKQSFKKLSMLRQDHYRTYINYPGFSIECRQQCVFDYLRSH